MDAALVAAVGEVELHGQRDAALRARGPTRAASGRPLPHRPVRARAGIVVDDGRRGRAHHALRFERLHELDDVAQRRVAIDLVLAADDFVDDRLERRAAVGRLPDRRCRRRSSTKRLESSADRITISPADFSGGQTVAARDEDVAHAMVSHTRASGAKARRKAGTAAGKVARRVEQPRGQCRIVGEEEDVAHQRAHGRRQGRGGRGGSRAACSRRNSAATGADTGSPASCLSPANGVPNAT